MKKKLSEFYPIDEKVITKIWESAIFVFDTNTLLHLYRYSKNTRNDFMQVLLNIKNSLWIPYQVALEFHQNRLNVIRESQKKYKALDVVLGDVQDIIKNSHNYGQYDDVLPIYKLVLKSVKHYANKLERMKKEVSDFDFRNDKILDFITELYENKVGDEQTEEELEEIYKEGKKRYENLIPPGYKDKKEKDTNRHIYGDLIIWKELIKEAKSANKDIIFITADTKEDWWLIFNGKTISPRSELVKEFSQTKRTILFYTPQNFLKWYKEKQNNNIQDSSINEVGEIQNQSYSLFDLSETLEKIQNQSQILSSMKGIDVESLTSVSKLQNLFSIPSDVKGALDNINEFSLKMSKNLPYNNIFSGKNIFLQNPLQSVSGKINEEKDTNE